MANYKHADVNQVKMTILNITDLFDEAHPTSQLWKLINDLDFSKFDASYFNDNVGRTAYDPKRVIAVIIWHLLYGNISMRQLERDLRCRADLLYLSGGQVFDHTSISRFRGRHRAAIEDLFNQTVFVGVLSGLIDFDTVCIDGSKLKGYASRDGFYTQAELEELLLKTKESCTKRLKDIDKAGQDTEQIQACVERLRKKQASIEQGLDFLRTHKDREKVHLTDPDCRWQKERNGSFTAGYNGQMAVDSKSQMIVSKKVISENSDNAQCVPMIESVKQIKEKCLEDLNCSDTALEREFISQLAKKTKYLLDAGYYSEENLKTLENEDIYMPDNYLSHYLKHQDKSGDADEIETEPAKDYKSITFKYDKKSDSFLCPRGKRLKYYRDIHLKGVLYRTYRVSGCKNCPLKEHCTTHHSRKELCVRPEKIEGLQVKTYQRRQYKGRLNQIVGAYTQNMREKLLSPAGKKIYQMRFWVSEGVFGLITSIRNGDKLLRRGLPRVNQEWTERSTAHNIGKLMSFRMAG